MHGGYKPADMNMVKQLLQFVLKIVIFNLLKGAFLMKFNDGKTFSAYVRPKLHSGYVTFVLCVCVCVSVCLFGL